MTTSVPVRVHTEPVTYQGYNCATLLLRSRRLAGIERDLAEYIATLDTIEEWHPHTGAWEIGVADELRRILGEDDSG